MLHKYHIISLLLLCIALFGFQESYAAVSRTYIPAPTISLVGATSDVRFDVASPLFGTAYSGVYLDTSTQTLSGVFYMNSIGWAMMFTGSYQVSLNCSESLNVLVNQCQFTGSGWSENIGEIGFSAVRYNPSTGTLTGSISSLAGNFSVVGVYLPLRPGVLTSSLTSLRTSHAGMLNVQNANQYGDGSWSMDIIPFSQTVSTRGYGGGTLGIFTVDLSFADFYTFDLTDPQGSVTRFSSVEVAPSQLTQTYVTAPGYLITQICNINPILPACIDRSATTLERVAVGIAIADGVSGYDMTLKTRDTYGNRITTGRVVVSYTGSVSAVQIPMNILSTSYDGLREQHDALIITGDIYPLWDLSGYWTDTGSLDSTASLDYHVASRAPTDSTNNIIILDRITYIALDGSTSFISDMSQFTFTPAYTHTITPPTSLMIGDTNDFQGSWSSHGLTPPADITTLLLIGSGNLADMKNIVSSPIGTSTHENTDWIIDFTPTTTLNIANISTNFTFSGTYVPRTAYPEIESLLYYSFVHYVIGGVDIVYPLTSGTTAPAEYQTSHVKILGQNNARSEYGTIATSTKSRTDFFNTLRKNIALLTRNRTDFTNTDYNVIVGNTSLERLVNNTSFTNKKTIIVIGGDITINSNINKDPDSPLAIIALADTNGIGGNINIDSNVTDISAGLFAEHAILTSGDNQLYVHGTLVSANTLGETAAGICPYFVSSCTQPEKYDLEEMRSYTGFTTASSSPRALEYPGTALIIEYDMRLQTNPPPGLPR